MKNKYKKQSTAESAREWEREAAQAEETGFSIQSDQNNTFFIKLTRQKTSFSSTITVSNSTATLRAFSRVGDARRC